jgi:hypothetical protein
VSVRRFRAGTHYNPPIDASDAVLGLGELGIDDETGAMKQGDGTTPFSALDPLPTVSVEAGTTITGGTP